MDSRFAEHSNDDILGRIAALKDAIALAGSEHKLGDGCGFSQVAINKAKKKGAISAEMAIAIHHFLKGAVPASRLRPDLWASAEHVPTKTAAAPPSPSSGEGPARQTKTAEVA